MSEYNENALYYHEQVVILDTTNAGSTSGGLVVKGGISGKDTYITGHVAVNNVKITPNKNDIIFEQQAILDRSGTFTDITDFNFDDSIANSFKAIINITVSGAISKYALWEINGVYKPSGWVITSSFTGDQTGVNFKIVNSSGRGQIQYTNSNDAGTTTTIRYRANTTAPPGSTPLGEGSGYINNTSGPYIANRLLYSNSVDTIANTDLVYASNVFTIGGTSRILAQNANSFTNFSNGGAITSMGDASIAKKMIVGEKVGIVTTSPQFHLDVTGDINFTGNFYKNGSLYSGSSIWDTNANSEIYTQQNLGIGTSDPTYKLDVSGGIRVTDSITAGALHVTNANVTNISSGTLNLSTGLTSGSAQITNANVTTSTISTLLNTNIISTNISSGTLTLSDSITSSSLYATNANVTTATVATLLNTNAISTNISSSTLTLSTGLTSGTAKITDISNTNASIGTLNVTALTAGNINFTGTLYENGTPYVNSQWTTGTGGNLSYTNGNVGINTTAPEATLDVRGTIKVSTGLTAANLNVSGTTVLGSVTTGTVSASTVNSSLVAASIITGGTLSLSGDLYVAGTLTAVNITTTNLMDTNITAGVAKITDANITTLLNTNVVSTNISSATLNLSSGITSASAQITNQNSTNVSAATLNLSTGITSNSAQITNANVTTSTIATARVTTSLLAIGNSNTVGAIITTGGNVGIGVSSPVAKLDVAGNGRFTGPGGVGTNGSLLITGQDFFGHSLYVAGAASQKRIGFQHTGTVGSIFAFEYGIESPQNLCFQLPGGNVGIGTSSPTAKLDVFGTIRASTSLTTGAVYSTNITSTNVVATNVSAGTLNLSTGLTSASAQITNANVTNLTVATLLTTNQNSTNVSSATINLSTGLTSASAQITNQNSTNISSATLTLSTGLTAASLQATNANITTATVSTLLNSNTVSTNVSAATLTLSTGLTSASAQITNENVTTSTIATARITTSLLAIGNSNTIGNIFTTGGNVGIGVVNPSLALEVSGRSVMKNAGIGTSGALYLDDNNKGIEYSGNNASVNSYFEGSFPTDGIAVFGFSDGALGTKRGGSKTSLAWNSTGNVGIGTTAPGAKLDVSGTIRASTSLTTGAVYSTNITSTNVVATNVSAGTLNLSTGLTSASLQATNANVTTATVATLLTTNVVATAVSTGSIDATGMTVGTLNLTSTNIALGANTASMSAQGTDAIAIGNNAGLSSQSNFAIAIGSNAGLDTQQANTVAIGNQAGYEGQNASSVAIGYHAGNLYQGGDSIAMGTSAGNYYQQGLAIAVGSAAGSYWQGYQSIAMGVNAGNNWQGRDTVAVGANAGSTSQGSYAVAIGSGAGQTSQHENSIILNASGAALDSSTAGAFYVSSVRNVTQANLLAYDTTLKEVTYFSLSDITTSNLVSTNISSGTLNASVGATLGSLNVTGGAIINTVNVTPSFGDISQERLFTCGNGVLSPASIAGFAFNNDIVRSFNAIVSVDVIKSVGSSLFSSYEVKGLQSTAGAWIINSSYIGDNTGHVFSINGDGQLLYTSVSQGGFASSTIKFRALTTSL